ncbi:OLC1v1000385C1 [Oldenlandia corymbosa var. corymbosa]|uniref:OLC1v1000385C1 n=1 Tax=Oldenlandia corymbosa var. corymbosa TaxID=529605 RepID=A0AAV1D5I3_OLDCO|nr:OLC1v1000385C1 [Oldenlandia corymbosa var. corymbosa]
MGKGARDKNPAPGYTNEVQCAGDRPLQLPVCQTSHVGNPGKGARKKNQAPACSNEIQGTGRSPLQEDESDFGTLTDTITSLLGAVKNMSLQLDEISSAVNDLVKDSKNVDASGGKSTSDEPVMSVDSKLHIVEEFHNLKQTTTVADYQEKFEELRDLMVKINFKPSEGYFISCFLSGLKPAVKESMENLKPETLYQAFNLARLQEIAIEEMNSKVMKVEGLKDKLRSSTRDDPNLQCKQVQVFFTAGNPLKFRASVGEREITILISTGIEDSYIDKSLALATGCKIEEAEPLRVHFLMLGYKAVSRFICPHFEWTMRGHKFNAEMRIVEIKAEYDIVLGADWVRENNPLSFSSDGIFLEKEGKEIVLLDKSGSGSANLQRSRRMCFTSDGIIIQEGEISIPLRMATESGTSCCTVISVSKFLERDSLFR